MIGVLGSASNRERLSEFFSHLLNSLNEYNYEFIFVFTIGDIDFLNRTICGNLISKDGIELSEIPIPNLILNVTNYRKRSNKRKVRRLAKLDNVFVINKLNVFKQYIIKEMLSSNPHTQDILLKYKTRLKDMDKHREVILYTQRGIEGAWNVLPGLQIPEDIGKSNALTEKLEFLAIESATWISCFIRSLGFSTVKFVLDKNLNPYLISLNGWDSNIMRGDFVNDAGNDFLKNLYDYERFLINREDMRN